MPYIDLAGLSRFDAAQKDALARDYALLRDMQWTRSEKAGAVSLWPAPSTPLEPSVDFLFTETPPASGDKGPDNPSVLEGVEAVNVARYSTNLFNAKNVNSSAAGVSISISEDGLITLNGTNNRTSGVGGLYFPFSPANLMKFNSGYLRIQAQYVGGTYTASATEDKVWGFQQSLIKQSDNVVLAYCNITNNTTELKYNYRFTVPVYLASQYLYTSAGSSFNNFQIRIMIEVSDTYSDIESAAFDSYSIDLGSTYYGGTLDVASGVMTVTWAAVELNGTETWDAISSYNSTTGIGLARCYPENIGLRKKAALDVTLNSACTHFSYLGNFGGTSISDGTVTTPRFFYTNGTASINGQARFAVPFSDVADFKAWLATQKTAGTPVMLTYKIYEPFTVTLTPTEILSLTQTDKFTPRLNTIYTDAQSVQVGYVKSPIRDEYELQQAVIAQGGNV